MRERLALANEIDRLRARLSHITAVAARQQAVNGRLRRELERYGELYGRSAHWREMGPRAFRGAVAARVEALNAAITEACHAGLRTEVSLLRERARPDECGSAWISAVLVPCDAACLAERPKDSGTEDRGDSGTEDRGGPGTVATTARTSSHLAVPLPR